MTTNQLGKANSIGELKEVLDKAIMAYGSNAVWSCEYGVLSIMTRKRYDEMTDVVADAEIEAGYAG